MRPGPWWSLLVLAGVAVGLTTPLPLLLAWLVGAALLCVAVALDARERRVAAALTLFAAAAAYGVDVRDRCVHNPLASWFAAETAGVSDLRDVPPVLVRGRLARDASSTPTGTSVAIAVSDVQARDGRWRAASGRVQATVGGIASPDFVDRAEAGRAVIAPVLLHAPQEARNPGSPSPEWSALRRTFDLAGSIKSVSLIELGDNDVVSRGLAAARRTVRRAIAATVAPLSPQSASIVTAILIGDRTGLDDEVVRELQIAGTYHVIAISGGNIAILTAVCLVVFTALTRSPRLTSAITLVVVLAYGALVGAQPSVERAVAAAACYLALGVVGVRPAPLPTLAAVAGFLAVVDPLAVVDVGAWLSFGATLGIIVMTPRAIGWATDAGRVPAHLRPRGRLRRLGRAAWLALVGMLATTASAEIALAPVSAAVFGRVGVAGLMLNLIAIPAMTIAQLAGTAIVCVYGWWPAAARAAAYPAHWGAAALVRSASLVEIVPELSLRTPPSWIGWIAIYYLGLAAAMWLGRSRRVRWAGGALAVATLAIVTAAPGLESARPPAGWLRVSLIDVGQGDAILVQFPTRQALLVDSGGTPSGFDIGGRVVLPAAWGLGERRLDWIAITHDDLDHIGGSVSVVRDLSPREVWEGVPVFFDAHWRMLRLAADARGLTWRPLTAGTSFQVGGVLVDVLNPPAPDWERHKVRNDDSLVLRLRFGLVEVLLTGDMEREVEQRWPPVDRLLPVRIVKVPHHGSRTSSSERWLDLVQPTIALVSVGRGNLFGHPAPDVIARYTARGTAVFRTDLDGAISCETNGVDVRVQTWTGRRLTVHARPDGRR